MPDRTETERPRIEGDTREQERQEDLARLAAEIAHELGNLLVPILAGIDVALDEVAPHGRAAAQLHLMGRAAEDATDLVRQLRALGLDESPADAAPESLEIPVPASAARRGAVLVIDDEEVVRQAAASALHRLGYDVITVDEGEKAIRLVALEPGRIESVVLDLTLPGKGSAAILEQLRALRPDLPVVLASGYSAEEAQGLLEQHSHTAFLAKPFSAARLEESLVAAAPSGEG